MAAPFKIIYDLQVRDHLNAIDKKYLALIKFKIEEQLLFEPNIETRNRKPLTKPPIDQKWELRFGPSNNFRVFYRTEVEKMEVWILAICEKKNGKLFIREREIKL